MRFKRGAYTEYVSILNRIVMHLSVIKSMQIRFFRTTRPLSALCIFEIGSGCMDGDPASSAFENAGGIAGGHYG
jgi:hypothetical protein